MKSFINKIRAWRIWPLFMKELRQIKADKKLVVSLILPPTVQLVIFGFALNPDVSNLRLGVVDESRSASSREVVSAFAESQSFRIAEQFQSAEELGRALGAGRLDAGLIVPSDYAKQRERRETARVQFLLDAVNSNTAGIAARLRRSHHRRAQRTTVAGFARCLVADGRWLGPTCAGNLWHALRCCSIQGWKAPGSSSPE